VADLPFELLVVGASLAAFLVLWGLLTLILRLPRFRRIPVHELLDDPNRRALLDMVRVEPGLPFQELARRTRQPPQRVRVELKDLERAGYIVRRRKDGQQRWYPSAAPRSLVRATKEARTVLAPQVLGALVEADAPSLANLARRTGIEEEALRKELLRLRKAGLVDQPQGPTGPTRITAAGRRAHLHKDELAA
jgi:predicted transcriptional regulator